MASNLWTDGNFSQLSLAQQRAVGARAQAASKESVEYLNDIGAGLSAVDSYVEEDKAQNRAALTAAADALFDAGQDASRMVGLGLAFAAATPEVQAQVDELLAPFAEAAAQVTLSQ
jgi:hypothetical protein